MLYFRTLVRGNCLCQTPYEEVVADETSPVPFSETEMKNPFASTWFRETVHLLETGIPEKGLYYIVTYCTDEVEGDKLIAKHFITERKAYFDYIKSLAEKETAVLKPCRHCGALKDAADLSEVVGYGAVCEDCLSNSGDFDTCCRCDAIYLNTESSPSPLTETDGSYAYCPRCLKELQKRSDTNERNHQ